MSFAEFVGRRLVRLYPLYLFGLLLGAITFLATPSVRASLSAAASAKAFALGLLVLPYLSDATLTEGGGAVTGPLFPFNGPAWSMFFELVANGAFFLLLYLRLQRLWPIIVVCGVSYLLAAYVDGGLNGGWGTQTFAVGFPRVLFAFFVGVALYRLHDFSRASPGHYGSLCVVLMLVVFVLPESRLVSVAAVLALGPLIIWTNSAAVPGPRLASAYRFLGAISYPLYITHVPVLRGLSLLAPESGWAAPAWVLTLVGTLAAVLVAWAVATLDDALRRRRFGRGLSKVQSP